MRQPHPMAAGERPARMPWRALAAHATQGSLRPILLILFALTVATLSGLGSAYLAVRDVPPFGAAVSGPWTAWPRLGARDIDPYARAVLARTADLPLGPGEGLTFSARTDDAGRPLEAGCAYRLAGPVPAARAWTLTLYDEAGRLVDNPARRHGFTSAEVLRDGAGTATLVLSRSVQSGNWLPLPQQGRFTLVLRLYDTPASASAAALDARAMPSIERTACE
ncbi:DUF1214 domain-containing protein [Chelatococcus sp. SYSU_G07232]|uniref:DUF1214 domain-containing protein n=1 Tax=Chelatococcus albus TaxID=3047466 RepID=A0ABT7AI35_9HYPH|nr:DUF1214 domain-containing protein [Chelatococcus sp. SYSU_G07232]MDJ1159042.1 DUF1214 domain-containing protein [Chelatococcus sp. SYSU_G07232]